MRPVTANIDLHVEYISEGMPFFIDRSGNREVEDVIRSLRAECVVYNRYKKLVLAQSRAIRVKRRKQKHKHEQEERTES